MRGSAEHCDTWWRTTARPGFGRVALAPVVGMQRPADLDARPVGALGPVRARAPDERARSPSPRAPIARCRAAPTGRATPPSARTRARARRRRGDAATRAPRGDCIIAVYASRSLAANGRRISRSVSSVGQSTTSAAGDGGDDADDLAVGDRGVEASQEADVFVGDEHVDEAAQRARVVEEALAETGVLRRRAPSGPRRRSSASTSTSEAPPERLRSCVGMRTVTPSALRLLDVERVVERVERRRDGRGRAARGRDRLDASSGRGR